MDTKRRSQRLQAGSLPLSLLKLTEGREVENGLIMPQNCFNINKAEFNTFARRGAGINRGS